MNEIPNITCKVTGNICGSDTWSADYICPCQGCTRWLTLREAIEAIRPMTKRGYWNGWDITSQDYLTSGAATALETIERLLEPDAEESEVRE